MVSNDERSLGRALNLPRGLYKKTSCQLHEKSVLGQNELLLRRKGISQPTLLKLLKYCTPSVNSYPLPWSVTIWWRDHAPSWPYDLFLHSEALIRGGVIRANVHPRVAIQIHHIINGRSVLMGIEKHFSAGRTVKSRVFIFHLS